MGKTKSRRVKRGGFDLGAMFNAAKQKASAFSTEASSKYNAASSSFTQGLSDASSKATAGYNDLKGKLSTGSTAPSSFGGRRHKRRMGGGYYGSSLAANAAPFSGNATARPQVWVGGKTKRRNKRRSGTKRRHRH